MKSEEEGFKKLYEKYGVKKQKISYKWLILVIVVIGIVALVYFTYPYIFGPVKCSVKIKEDIDTLRLNITSLSNVYSTTIYYQDVESNITLIESYLNQAEEYYNSNKCSDASSNLELAATNVISVINYLVTEETTTQLICSYGGISLSNLNYCDGVLSGTVENRGTIDLGNIKLQVVYENGTSQIIDLGVELIPREMYLLNANIQSNYDKIRVITNCSSVYDQVTSLEVSIC